MSTLETLINSVAAYLPQTVRDRLPDNNEHNRKIGVAVAGALTFVGGAALLYKTIPVMRERSWAGRLEGLHQELQSVPMKTKLSSLSPDAYLLQGQQELEMHKRFLEGFKQLCFSFDLKRLSRHQLEILQKYTQDLRKNLQEIASCSPDQEAAAIREFFANQALKIERLGKELSRMEGSLPASPALKAKLDGLKSALPQTSLRFFREQQVALAVSSQLAQIGNLFKVFCQTMIKQIDHRLIQIEDQIRLLS